MKLLDSGTEIHSLWCLLFFFLIQNAKELVAQNQALMLIDFPFPSLHIKVQQRSSHNRDSYLCQMEGIGFVDDELGSFLSGM